MEISIPKDKLAAFCQTNHIRRLSIFGSALRSDFNDNSDIDFLVEFDDDLNRLRPMLDAASEALGFAQGKSRADLDNNRMLVLSLVKDIEIIGEAAYQISESTRQMIPSIPWDEIFRMSHRLVHAYFEIDLDILWRTVTDLCNRF